MYQTKLAPEIEAAFWAIRQRIIHDNDLRDIIEGLGNLVAHGDVRTNKERSVDALSSGAKAVAQYLLDVKPPKNPPRK